MVLLVFSLTMNLWRVSTAAAAAAVMFVGMAACGVGFFGKAIAQLPSTIARAVAEIWRCGVCACVSVCLSVSVPVPVHLSVRMLEPHTHTHSANNTFSLPPSPLRNLTGARAKALPLSASNSRISGRQLFSRAFFVVTACAVLKVSFLFRPPANAHARTYFTHSLTHSRTGSMAQLCALLSIPFRAIATVIAVTFLLASPALAFVFGFFAGTLTGEAAAVDENRCCA